MHKKIIVAGGSNQIGFFLLPKLERTKTNWVSLSRNQHVDEHWFQLDLSDVERCSLELPRAETWIHLGPLWLLTPLIEVLYQKGVRRIIAFSSTSVFVKQNSSDLKELSVIRNLIEAESHYQQECERFCINWTLFRPTMIYGAGMDSNVHFVSERMRKWRVFPVPGKADGLRQPVHADDLAQACMDVLDNPKAYNKAYNLSGGETLSYRTFLKRIADQQSHRVIFIPLPHTMLRWFIIMLRKLPFFSFVNTEMLERTRRDLCFSHEVATEDFGYKPKAFLRDS